MLRCLFHSYIHTQSEIGYNSLFISVFFVCQMDGKALVHREVQDYESKRFMNYFEAFTVLKGK